jgi:peptidoglycan/LPS O-acetylase OafA/YrhL
MSARPGSPAGAKPFFAAIDGLRGVVCILIVVLHTFEAHSASLVDPTSPVEAHGYLTVDFFFCLSGYITAYAYDDRWDRLTLGSFVKRRLIRLHPLVLAGTAVGALCFYFQDGPIFPLVSRAPASATLLAMAAGMAMVPLPPSLDIRGWVEMYPLNGPAWTLFFEYAANFAYAAVLRRLPSGALGLLAAAAGAALVHLAATNPKGNVAGGWSLEPSQLRLGFTRLAYPFLAGLLLFRVARPIRFARFPFWALLLFVAVLVFPRIGGESRWANGLYDAVAIIALLPVLVLIAAGAEVGGAAARACRFAGAMSYPISITHYPVMLVYTAWVSRAKPAIMESAVVGAVVCVISVAMGYAFLRWYDIPVRAWLQKRLLA